MLALGLAMAASSFSQPATRSERFAAYSNAGVFSYSARTTRADPVVYPDGVAHTGQPLVLGDIDQVTERFSYRFRSRLQHGIQGTIAFQVVFVGESGWRNAYKLAQAATFAGDSASTTGTLSLSGLGRLLAKLQAGSARAAGSYTVYLQPVVHYAGVVGGRRLHGTFSPTLPFVLDAAVFAPKALNLQDPSSKAQTLETDLHPTQPGQSERSVANVISFLALRAPALDFRIGGCLLAAIGLLFAARGQRRRRDDVWSHERRVAHRAGRALIEVRGLEQTLTHGSITTEVASFEDLVALAAQTERPILHEVMLDGEVFGVDLPPRLYLYRKPVEVPAGVPEPMIAGTMPAHDVLAPPRRGQPLLQARPRS